RADLGADRETWCQHYSCAEIGAEAATGSGSTPPRFHETGMRELSHLHARGLARLRLELEVDASVDTAPRLLIRQLPEAAKVAGLVRKAPGSGPRDRECHIIPIEHELQRPG